MNTPSSSRSVIRSEAQGKESGQPATATHPDSPFATSLPSWDLLPLHTLLVRRRPVKK